jgi:hypothetical protein
MSFKNRYLFNDRLLESRRINIKYPDRIPIICERSNNPGDYCPIIDKNKYFNSIYLL